MSVTQTPREEFHDRATEQAPAWLTLPQLAAVQNLRQLWADASRRTWDSHRAQMKTLGTEATEPDDVGDIDISGDHTTTHHHYHEGEGVLKRLIPLALAAALGFGGAWFLLRPRPTPPLVTPTPETDWELGIEVSDKP